MTNDEMKQVLLQKYEELQRKRFSSFKESREDYVGPMLWHCRRQSEFLNLDKETEYLLVAVTALERCQEITKTLIHQFNIRPPEPITVEGVTYKYIGPWPPA